MTKIEATDDFSEEASMKDLHHFSVDRPATMRVRAHIVIHRIHKQ
jgi:hypothetical protein